MKTVVGRLVKNLLKNALKIRQDLKNLKRLTKLIHLQGKDEEIFTISLMRDLFGSILFLFPKQRINMGKVLKSWPTQVPLSCEYWCKYEKTPKIKLLVELVSRVASVKLASIYVMIIGQMFFLHLLADPQPAIWLNSSVYSWLSLFTNKS